MLPFPPSVRIFVLPTTGFPEKADIGQADESSLLCADFEGVRMRWLISFRVMSPWAPLGLMKVNG